MFVRKIGRWIMQNPNMNPDDFLDLDPKVVRFLNGYRP